MVELPDFEMAEGPVGDRAVGAYRVFVHVECVVEDARMPKPGEVLLARRRIIGANRVRRPVQRHTLQHSRNPEAVVAMKVGQAQPGDRTCRNAREKKLALSSL